MFERVNSMCLGRWLQRLSEVSDQLGRARVLSTSVTGQKSPNCYYDKTLPRREEASFSAVCSMRSNLEQLWSI
jgi:hypothetical protein